MHWRSSLFVLAIGFSILIVLIMTLGFGAIRRADTIYMQMQVAQDSYWETETARRNIASDIYLADVFVRDYLLDSSARFGPKHRQKLLLIRRSIQQHLDQLASRMPARYRSRLASLQAEVDGYWDSLEPIFQWTPQKKAARSRMYLARQILPRGEAVVSLTYEVARLNSENLEMERQRLRNSQQVFHKFLLQMMASSLIIGSLVALLTTYLVLVFERQHEEQRRQIESSHKNLRRLSQRLVQAQENERQVLSPELPDPIAHHTQVFRAHR